MLKKTNVYIAFRIPTGIGKTRMSVQVIAEAFTLIGTAARRLAAYFTPTHRLGEDVVELFAAHGLSARVFRGRTADVPNDPTKRKMCLNLRQVELAIEAGELVSETCCYNKKTQCECLYYNQCAYQAQFAGPTPVIWVCAHELLFHEMPAFGDPVIVVIDESFWQDGLRLKGGYLRLDDMRGRWTQKKYTAHPKSMHGTLIGRRQQMDEAGELNALRNKLADTLDAQPENDGVVRTGLVAAFTYKDCSRALYLEHKLKLASRIYPGMPQAELAEVEKRLPAIRFSRRMTGIWLSIRDLIDHPEISVSGRLLLGVDKKGYRGVKLRGLTSIREQWDAVTWLLDATLPALPILQAYYPEIEVVDYSTDLPDAVKVRQLVNAPTTAGRLIRTPADFNRQAIRWYILARWLEFGRQPTLIVAQQKIDVWLQASGLPDNIFVEHFNNIEGLDEYKHVRLLIVVGRTIPEPREVEAMAAALTGSMPLRVKVQGRSAEGSPWRWYDLVKRGVTYRDPVEGLVGLALQCDQHPDEVCESIRWQICEGGVVQAIGRARAINRGAADPVQVDILANVCVPVTLNEFELWGPNRTTSTVEMLVEGVLLSSPSDLTTIWPHVWANEKAAERALRQVGIASRSPEIFQNAAAKGEQPDNLLNNNVILKEFVRLLYQRVGNAMQPRYGLVDPKIIPDPKVWLEKRLGPLARFEMLGPLR